MRPDTKQLWLELRDKNCELCTLHESAQAVCLMGVGPVPAKIMVIGEAPGYREDEIKRPFAGRSGQFLRETLKAAGIDPEVCFITNVNKCRPPENRTPTKTEAKACRVYLDGEIERVKPEFILLVGNHALTVIKKSGIMKQRGEIFKLGDAKVMPTIHPAAVLRNPRLDGIFKTDIAAFGRLVRGEPGATPPKTYLVKSRKTLEIAIRSILASEAIAYDLETNGFDDFIEEAKIATIGIAVKPGVAFVVPIDHPETPWRRPDVVLRAVANALTYTNAKRIAHNAKFDDRWLISLSGRPIYADFDSMIAAYIMDENRLKGLKPLAQMLLGVDAWAIDAREVMSRPLKDVARYNGKDADYTLRLYYGFKEELLRPENIRTLRLFQKLLMPASRVLTDVERTGIWLDEERLAQRTIEVNEKIRKVSRRLSKIYGVEANWNSTNVIGDLLFNKLGLPMLEETPKGKPSTKESVLLRLRHEHKAAALILEYRKWAKFKSTYLQRWAEVRDVNGRMHPNYKITGTVTGRLSSGKEDDSKGRGLNVQQVPRDPLIRSIIGAPPGWRFVEADFSQVELRLAAHYSRDATMQRLFQAGTDIHLQTAATTTGKHPKDITKEERKKAKAVNFGFLYGMGAEKFITYARDNYDVVVTLEEARQVRDRFFETYRALRPWHERQRRLARRYHRVQSAIGRVRHLPDILSADEDVRAEAERQAINSPVQSLASDMMLLAMVILHEMMPPDEVRIVGTIHDALLFEIREDVVDKWVPVIHEVMENLPLKRKFGVELSVPIVVDIRVGQHWSEGEVMEWAS